MWWLLLLLVIPVGIRIYWMHQAGGILKAIDELRRDME